MGKVLWHVTMSLDGFIADQTTRWTGCSAKSRSIPLRPESCLRKSSGLPGRC
jgi:hypothetical protein